MDLLPPKTPEQALAEHNAFIQRETWLENKRIEFRETALRVSQNYNYPNASQTLEEADKIYKWLISVL